jgi:serine/threonine protein phosphatase PrpC
VTESASQAAASEKRAPAAHEIDAFGMSDVGKVRKENQDHFLVASLHQTLDVHGTNIVGDPKSLESKVRRGFVMMVADGVGGGVAGEEASKTAVRAITRFVTEAMEIYDRGETSTDPKFAEEMVRAIERAHDAVKDQAEQDETHRGMATTLTLVISRWPRLYLVHVGDSRCYRLRNGELELLTKDQTMAQMMLDLGKLKPEDVDKSRLKNVLWSALGGSEASPDTLALPIEWQNRMLLCTDGLTKHVTDEEIKAHLGRDASSEEICRSLIALALERGGTDNVTVVVVQLRRDPE